MWERVKGQIIQFDFEQLQKTYSIIGNLQQTYSSIFLKFLLQSNESFRTYGTFAEEKFDQIFAQMWKKPCEWKFELLN